MDSGDQSTNKAQNSSLTQAVQSSVPVDPAGQGYKEQEPVVSPSSLEHIVSSEKGPEISPEVAKAGVETVSELPKITPEHEKIGIVRAKESTPHPLDSTSMQLSMSASQIQQAIKESKDDSDSKSWLLRLWNKVLKKIK